MELNCFKQDHASFEDTCRIISDRMLQIWQNLLELFTSNLKSTISKINLWSSFKTLNIKLGIKYPKKYNVPIEVGYVTVTNEMHMLCDLCKLQQQV